MYLVAAFCIGVYGYLLPGIINVTLAELSGNRRKAEVLLILLPALLFEWLYCYVALYGFKQVPLTGSTLNALQFAGCIAGLFAGCLYLWPKKAAKKREALSIISCLTIIVIHPQQLSFWIFVHLLLSPFIRIASIGWFATFNTLGALAIFLCYIFPGGALYRKIGAAHTYIRLCIGGLYILTGLWGILHLW